MERIERYGAGAGDSVVCAILTTNSSVQQAQKMHFAGEKSMKSAAVGACICKQQLLVSCSIDQSKSGRVAVGAG
eukprot:scaffold3605_cov92-Skeletonema_dohrnii-CCMP3373.AAC.1